MLAFALSFDDLVVTTFNAGVGSTTLPLYIYSAIKFGVTPEINAISTIIVARDGRRDPPRVAVRAARGRGASTAIRPTRRPLPDPRPQSGGSSSVDASTQPSRPSGARTSANPLSRASSSTSSPRSRRPSSMASRSAGRSDPIFVEGHAGLLMR